jgi:hypothetical protein
MSSLHLAHRNGTFPCVECESTAPAICEEGNSEIRGEKKGSSPTPTIQRLVPTGALSGAAVENALLATKCVSVKLGDENDTTTDVSFIP